MTFTRDIAAALLPELSSAWTGAYARRRRPDVFERAVPGRCPRDADLLGIRPQKVYSDFKSGSPWTRGWSPPPLPEDGRFPVRVTFGEPGTFVLRVLAHDGGAATTQEVTITVSR